MTRPQIIVSLLGDAAESDRLLDRVHRLLPRAHAATTAVLRPPTPDLFAAVVRGLPEGTVVVTDQLDQPEADHDRRQGSLRWFGWCREEADTERCHASMTALLAEDVDALAWELVRHLAGDGGDTPLRLAEPSRTAVAAPEGELRGHRMTDPPAASPVPAVASDAMTTLAADATPARVPPPAWASASLTGRAQLGESTPVAATATPRPPRLTIPSWATGSTGARPHGAIEAMPSSPPTRRDTPPVVSPPSEVLHPTAPPSSDLPSPLASLAAGLPRPAPEALAPDADVARSAAEQVPDHASPDLTARCTANTRGGRSLRGGIRRVSEALRPRGAERPAELAPLGQRLVRCHSTVVLVGTSKGGPGKTTQAAAIAMLGAQAVEPHGGSGVFIEANLNNPDAWKRLGVPAHAATVREVVDALNRGAVPPEGALARDARLRVFPEVRGGMSSYSAAEVDRLVRHLRLRNTLVVVDLPNVLPSLVHGPNEAVVAHWLRHADVFVLPLDLGAGSFVAAGEVLDALDELVATPGGPPRMPGVVVPLLVPRGGERTVRSPEVSELLGHLREAGADVVEVPHTVEVQAADHFKRPVIGVSPRADSAFMRVLRAVVDATAIAHGEASVPDA